MYSFKWIGEPEEEDEEGRTANLHKTVPCLGRRFGDTHGNIDQWAGDTRKV